MARDTEQPTIADGTPARSLSVYRIALLLVVVVSGALGLQSAGARLLARSAPDLALRVSPNDAIALGRKANSVMMFGSRDAVQLKSARRYAARSVRRDLTRDDALFVLGAAIETNNPEQARRVISQAEALSRRNFIAQLWLIEDSVRVGNAEGALRHFDIALRTTESAGAVLYPVLRNAVDDPQLTNEIGRTVNAAPWRNQFLQYAVSLNRPSAALAQVFALQRGLAPFQGTDLKAAFVAQLVANRLYGAAARLALPPGADLVQDSRFEGRRGVPPFAWQLIEGSGIIAEFSREAEGSRLHISADEGAEGGAAAQLIRAPAGSYILSVGMDEDRLGLFARLECAEDKRELAMVPIIRSTKATVSVPTGCPYQNLNVIVASVGGRSGAWQLTHIDLIPN